MGGPSYGKALYCFDRRVFGVVVSFIILAISIERIFAYSLNRYVYHTELTLQHPCYGKECYEVFTCKGLSETTFHFREPLDTIFAFVGGAAGLLGSFYGRRGLVAWFSWYCFWATLVQACCLAGDVGLWSLCGGDSFPTNVVQQGLLTLPVPLVAHGSARSEISRMLTYPTQDVYKIAKVDVWKWYFFVALGKLLVFAYLTWETSFYARVMDRGLTGMGVHYGLGQWDEKPLFLHKHARGSLDSYQTKIGFGETPGIQEHLKRDPAEEEGHGFFAHARDERVREDDERSEYEEMLAEIEAAEGGEYGTMQA